MQNATLTSHVDTDLVTREQLALVGISTLLKYVLN